MADKTTQAPAAQGQDAPEAPTVLSSASVIEALKSGASVDPLDYLAALDVPATDEAKPISEAEETTVPPADAEAEETADVEADPEDTEELEEIAKADPKELPHKLQKRLDKLTAHKYELREQLAAEKSAREALETELAQAKEHPATPLPASPLAHLDTTDKLAAEVEKATNFLDWAERPEAIDSYTDDEQGIAEDKLKRNKAYALFILKSQNAQANVIKQQQESVTTARKSAPTLFDPKHEDHAFLNKLLVNDPRTLPDFHSVVADAVKWRSHQKEASAKKESAIKALAAKPPLNSKDKANGKTPPKFVPPVSASRAPVSNSESGDPRVTTWHNAKNGKAQDIDAMISAGAI